MLQYQRMWPRPRATSWCGAPPFRILRASTSSGARWPTTTTWCGVLRWAITAIALVVPGVEATFTVSEVFAFTSVLLFGPEAGAVTLALDCLVLAWHRRIGIDKAAFNFGNLTLAAWTSGTLFFAVSGARPLLHGGQAATLIMPLALPVRARTQIGRV